MCQHWRTEGAQLVHHCSGLSSHRAPSDLLHGGRVQCCCCTARISTGRVEAHSLPTPVSGLSSHGAPSDLVCPGGGGQWRDAAYLSDDEVVAHGRRWWRKGWGGDVLHMRSCIAEQCSCSGKAVSHSCWVCVCSVHCTDAWTWYKGCVAAAADASQGNGVAPHVQCKCMRLYCGSTGWPVLAHPSGEWLLEAGRRFEAVQFSFGSYICLAHNLARQVKHWCKLLSYFGVLVTDTHDLSS